MQEGKIFGFGRIERSDAGEFNILTDKLSTQFFRQLAGQHSAEVYGLSEGEVAPIISMIFGVRSYMGSAHTIPPDAASNM